MLPAMTSLEGGVLHFTAHAALFCFGFLLLLLLLLLFAVHFTLLICQPKAGTCDFHSIFKQAETCWRRSILKILHHLYMTINNQDCCKHTWGSTLAANFSFSLRAAISIRGWNLILAVTYGSVQCEKGFREKNVTFWQRSLLMKYLVA